MFTVLVWLDDQLQTTQILLYYVSIYVEKWCLLDRDDNNIHPVLSPVYSFNPYKFAPKLGNYFCINETDENDPFGRNIQAANSPPQ